MRSADVLTIAAILIGCGPEPPRMACVGRCPDARGEPQQTCLVEGDPGEKCETRTVSNLCELTGRVVEIRDDFPDCPGQVAR